MEGAKASPATDDGNTSMLPQEWLIAYSDWPGRYYVVYLGHPRWLYIFDHVKTENGCELQSQAFQSLTKGVASEKIYSPELADRAYGAFAKAVAWFEPMPICEASDYHSAPPKWFFGTSPATCNDERSLLGFRLDEDTSNLARLSFDESGILLDIEADDDLFVQVQDAFEVWSAIDIDDPTRKRFQP